MRIADLNTGLSQLRTSYEELQRAWNQTRLEWTDQNSQNLEENYLRPIHSKIQLAFQSIDQLNSVLEQAARECGPWDSAGEFTT